MTADPTTSSPSLRQRIPLYVSQVVCAMVMASLGPLLDSIMDDLDIPLSRGGIVSLGFFLGGVVSIVVLNCRMARVPAKQMLVIGMLLQGLGLALVGAVSRDLWSASLAYLLVGVGGNLVNATCWIWLPAHVKEHLAAATLLMITFFAAGMIATPFILGIVIDQGASWRWILIVEGALSAVTGFVYIGLPFLDVRGRHNVRFAHLRQVVSRNRGLLIGILAAIFMYTGAETVLNIWLPKFHIDVFDASDTWAGFSVTLFWIGLIAGRLAAMPLTRRFSPARILVFCASALAVMTLALALAPNLAVSLVFVFGAGLGASGSFGLIGSYSGRFPGWEAGVVSSLFILVGSLGCAVFPYLFGPLADAAGYRIALATVAVPAIIYGLFSLLIHARSGD